jgi:hypothetical protein
VVDCDDSTEDKKDNSRNNDNNEQKAALFTYFIPDTDNGVPSYCFVRAASVHGMITE